MAQKKTCAWRLTLLDDHSHRLWARVFCSYFRQHVCPHLDAYACPKGRPGLHTAVGLAVASMHLPSNHGAATSGLSLEPKQGKRGSGAMRKKVETDSLVASLDRGARASPGVTVIARRASFIAGLPACSALSGTSTFTTPSFSSTLAAQSLGRNTL